MVSGILLFSNLYYIYFYFYLFIIFINYLICFISGLGCSADDVIMWTFWRPYSIYILNEIIDLEMKAGRIDCDIMWTTCTGRITLFWTDKLEDLKEK